METLEDHPIFNPAIKISHQQNEKKKPAPATEAESTLNLNLFEKSAAATEEEKGKVRGAGAASPLQTPSAGRRTALSWGFLLGDNNMIARSEPFVFAETLAKPVSLWFILHT